jgi:predicted DNA-binding transcriptional regulator AlpA
METNTPYQDNDLLSPKQMAVMANISKPTIYLWLDKSHPENPVIQGTRVRYRAVDVKVWLDQKTEKKRLQEALREKVRTTRRIARQIANLYETDSQRYLAIIALLDGTNEPANND